MPKALDYCGFVLGRTANSCMTVIELRGDHVHGHPKMGSYPKNA